VTSVEAIKNGAIAPHNMWGCDAAELPRIIALRLGCKDGEKALTGNCAYLTRFSSRNCLKIPMDIAYSL
jgi:hypothetical protein